MFGQYVLDGYTQINFAVDSNIVSIPQPDAVSMLLAVIGEL